MQAQITSARPSSAPTSGRVRSVTAITTAAAIPTITTHLNTAASLILMFVLRTSALKDIYGDVDDDPHDVHEVPVDAWHLDTKVVIRLGAEVAAEGADRREREQHQADEYVGS